MKRLINIVLCLAMLVASSGSVTVAAAEAEDVRVNPGVDFSLQPSAQTVKVGQAFTVNIIVNPTAYLGGTDSV